MIIEKEEQPMTEEQRLEAAIETVFKLKEMEGQRYCDFRRKLDEKLKRKKNDH